MPACACGREAAWLCGREPCCSRACAERAWARRAAPAVFSSATRARLRGEPNASFVGEEATPPVSSLKPLSMLDRGTYTQGALVANGLRYVLGVDATRASTCVALDVGVGSAHDPAAWPGLSHLVEHMLFLGTRAHPDASSFHEYVAAGGGSMNAYTGLETSNFHFSVDPERAQRTLDWFAEFFVDPLLAPEALGKELAAVDAEHSKNLGLEARRLHRLVSSLSTVARLASFSTGTRALLERPAVHEQARTHARTHYASASTMRLCVLGPEPVSLAAFERIARGVQSGGGDDDDRLLSLEEAEREAEPFFESGPRLVRIDTPATAPTYVFAFPCPPLHRLASRALLLVEAALQEALEAALPEATIVVQRDMASRTTLLLEVCVDTGAGAGAGASISNTHGLGTIAWLCSLFFGCMHSLVLGGVAPLEARAADARCLAALRERYAQGDYETASACASLASEMRAPPLSLFASRAPTSRAAAEALAILERWLVPHRMRLHVLAPIAAGVPTQLEPYYKIRYTQEMPYPTLHQFATAATYTPPSYAAWRSLCAAILAPTNHMLWPLPQSASERHPTDERLLTLEQLVGRGEVPYPRPLASPNVTTLWHKRDEFYAVPRLSVRLLFVGATLSDEWRQEAERVCSKRGASRTGTVWELEQTRDGVTLSVDGCCAAEANGGCGVVGEVVRDIVGARRGGAAHKKKETAVVYEQAVTLLNDALSVPISGSGAGAGAGAVGEIVILVHGNARPEDALALVNSLPLALGARDHSASVGWPRRRAVDVRSSARLDAPLRDTQAAERQHACIVAVPVSSSDEAACVLLAELLEQPLYAQLRTRDQLGYIVHTAYVKHEGVAQLRVLVQSAREPRHVHARILAALDAREAPASFDARDRVVARTYGRDTTLEASTDTLWARVLEHGRVHGARVAAEPHLLAAFGKPAAEAPLNWPRFDKRFSDVSALARLTRFDFEGFARGFAQRPHVALYARDARSPRDADAAAIDEWQRTSYLAPLI